ncbi:hypothetical protein LX73_0158 [Fodinibius salinus]|uniref:Uncharacterized protein n=1 Tax=Fodinibius salinus TaxID=860790 RepID=A0A5D3YNE5_9BACT|nr:hypothetical protein [Fodinibius salinus]TYP94868.1 hypothetical protein LX73_0158 [Fodinibius salinus]
MEKESKEKIDAHAFFGESTYLDLLALKPLSHIHPHWELTWDSKNSQYIPEENSFTEELNELLAHLNRINPPDNYHEYEDRVIKKVQKQSNERLFKLKGEWVEFVKNEIIETEYDYLLEQGHLKQYNDFDLLKAATGRIKAAIKREQNHFDDMEHSHQLVLAAILSIILYVRYLT